ncbi:hypothetical protein EXU85_01185 [Spirosoma sp. KCTC 42546]|uniref:hypothetical protein n=1 Tax=Spirosoma sp. KCTC 42546 TaxID=2520506 RepID=UPI00115A3843|nr:hypothetical protein [Spirosoma sp. KCTC 42546]QDK77279.1 hypothetical protein EXU85_01185 [Spirosoma sp. KCTC 42546]
MTRSRLLIVLLSLLQVVSYGQCVVSQDDQKRVITICQSYTDPSGLLINRTDRKQGLSQTVYLGSEYLTYPIWQIGSFKVVGSQSFIPCGIAYNLLTNQVLCQFPGDSVPHVISPEAFTINDMQFVSRLNNKAKRIYYRVLYAGKTRLLAQYKCTFRPVSNEPYTLEQSFDGTYLRKKSFYIQQQDNTPLRPVQLSRKSVLNVLAVPPTRLPNNFSKKKITVHELVSALAYYDGFN